MIRHAEDILEYFILLEKLKKTDPAADSTTVYGYMYNTENNKPWFI